MAEGEPPSDIRALSHIWRRMKERKIVLGRWRETVFYSHNLPANIGYEPANPPSNKGWKLVHEPR